MKIISVVPARSGSKSIRDKNLQKVRGHSLIAWAVTVATSIFESSTFIDTDSREYAAEAAKYGAIVPFLRRPELAGDTTSDTESFREFASRMALDDDTAIVHLRPTTPLRSLDTIEKAVKEFQSMTSSRFSLRSLHEMSESAYKCFEVDTDGLIHPLGGLVGSTEKANQPRESFPKTYVANGYIDIFKASNLRRFHSIHGPDIQSFLTETAVEVDSPYELEVLRLLAEKSEFDRLVYQMDRKVADV